MHLDFTLFGVIYYKDDNCEGNMLTKKQEKLLKFLCNFREKYGESPSLSIIVKNQKLSSNRSVIDMLRTLVNGGYLEPAPKISRSTKLTFKALCELGLLMAISFDNQTNQQQLLPLLYHPTSVQSSMSTNSQPTWPDQQQNGSTGVINEDIVCLLRNTASLNVNLGTSKIVEREKYKIYPLIYYSLCCLAIFLIFGKGFEAAIIFVVISIIILRSTK